MVCLHVSQMLRWSEYAELSSTSHHLEVMSSGSKQQVFSWWELSSTLRTCLLHCFYQRGLASTGSVADTIMHSITWFSLSDYIFSRNNQGEFFFPLPLPGKCWVVFTAKQNSPFPDKLLSAWGNALIFSITSTARVEALDKKKKERKGKGKKRKKRINAQVGYLAGRIHLEWASNCCSLTRQCLKPGWWMNIFANILHDFTVEGLQQMQTQ